MATKGDAFYYGCIEREGHFYFDTTRHFIRVPGIPWKNVDGKLAPTLTKVQGRALLHHKDGWTALAMWDYSVDSRPGSNSVFLFEGRMGFDEAVEKAEEVFPEIVERIGEITRAMK